MLFFCFQYSFPWESFTAAYNLCIKYFIHPLSHLYWRRSIIYAMHCFSENPIISEKSQIVCNKKINFFLLKNCLHWALRQAQSIHQSLFVNSNHSVKEEVCLLFFILFCFWQNFTNSWSWQNTDICFWLATSAKYTGTILVCRTQLWLRWKSGEKKKPLSRTSL